MVEGGVKGEGIGGKGGSEEGEVRWERRGIRRYLIEVDEKGRMMKYVGTEGRGTC